MRFYIASKFDNHSIVRNVCDALLSRGHQITFDWTRTDAFACRIVTGMDGNDRLHWQNVGGKGTDLPPRMQHHYALQDLNGARSCDILVLLISDDMCGALMEVGMALASGKPVFVIGKITRWTIFYALPQVRFFNHLQEFYDYIRDWR